MVGLCLSRQGSRQVKFMGGWCAGSAKYMSDAVPQLLAGCKDKDHNVRQCSVYGLGILAQQHHEAFRATLRDALMAILGIITAPGAR